MGNQRGNDRSTKIASLFHKADETPRVGLWLIGAGGRVGGTVALGLAALARDRASDTGLVSALPHFGAARLVRPTAFVLGGHEVRSQGFLESVQEAHQRAGLFSADLIEACSPILAEMRRNVAKGTTIGMSSAARELLGRPEDESETPAAAVDRLAADIRNFKERNKLGCVVVVNVASSEPAASAELQHLDFAALQVELSRKRDAIENPVPSSCLYALAAIEAGCPYVNFTPSTGIGLPAIRARAEQRGIPYMGNDGKTGETLVKSALAPMFAARHLKILSWVGQNILGNPDGAVLADPETRAAKLRTKDHVVPGIVGGSPETHVSIDYVESLDDWKVAWDFIHFEGFLGTKMSMQFTWQGCDSILAAPLIIDLARFVVLAQQRGEVGAMLHLAFFFKEPMDVDAHDLATQWRVLVEHVTGCDVDSKWGL